MEPRPWDFQGEECILRACVDRFNNRRYISGGGGAAGANGLRGVNSNAAGGGVNGGGPSNGANGNGMIDINEYDQNLMDIMNGGGGGGVPGGSDRFNYMPGYGGWDEDVELNDEFKEHYELWLQQDVFAHQIDWDSLIQPSEI